MAHVHMPQVDRALSAKQQNDRVSLLRIATRTNHCLLHHVITSHQHAWLLCLKLHHETFFSIPWNVNLIPDLNLGSRQAVGWLSSRQQSANRPCRATGPRGVRRWRHRSRHASALADSQPFRPVNTSKGAGDAKGERGRSRPPGHEGVRTVRTRIGEETTVNTRVCENRLDRVCRLGV
jgi:hypothetical protein